MRRPKGTSNRQLSNEEKEKILLEHYNEHVPWNEIYKKYNLSSSLVYSWSVKYRENGVRGLDSNSGKHNNNYGGLYLKKPEEEHKKFNNLVWNGWKKLTRPFQVIISDMTVFWVKNTYYELTLYFDAWNKEIIGYGLVSNKGDIKSYYDGLNQVLNKIKEEQIEEPIVLHTDQGSVYSSYTYNNLLKDFNIQRSMSRAGTPTDNPVNESLNGWIKEELFIDFDLKHTNDVPNLIKLYIDYYNNERPSYALNYKTPIQYKIESGF